MNSIENLIKKIQSNKNLVIRNIIWLFFDKLLRIGMGLLIFTWLARYLGSEQFGLLNFSIAFVTLFGAIASCGLQSIVIRDLVRNPKRAQTILGTTAFIQLIGGIIAYILVIIMINYLRPDDYLGRVIVYIIGLIHIIKLGDIAVIWFESKVQSKYTVIVQNIVFLIFGAIKALLIYYESSLITFAWMIFLESALATIVLLVVMGRRGMPIANLSFNLKRAKFLLKNCWPLMISSFSILAYLKIDQIMLAQMVGNEAVGIYSAAIKISEVWYFIPVVIVSTMYPILIKSKKNNSPDYLNNQQKIYDTVILISFLIAIPVTLASDLIVNLLFGIEYRDAGSVLAIHIWAIVFVSLGVASHNWLLTENLQILSMQRAVLGALLNIGLNLLLIPKYGPNGAAAATLLSHAVADFFYDAFNSKTKVMFRGKLRAFNFIRFFK
jgi:O-antigen/teichoic acid export membrane protein